MKRSPLLYAIALIAFTLTIGCAPSPLVRPEGIHYPPLRFSTPTVERVELANGIVLFVLEDHELPLINITAVVRTGSVYDPVGKEGLADMTASVMRTGGTVHMTGDEIDEALDYMAATISVSAGRESATVTLSVMKQDIDMGLKVFSDILINPIFDEDKLRIAKELKIEALRRVYDNPQTMAFREFTRLFYRGNPRGRLDSVRSVTNIARVDMARFHRQFFFPANIMMAVTGDITKDEAVAKITGRFGTWATIGSVETIPPPAKHDSPSLNYLHKDVPQSIIILGNLGPGKKDPDYYTFEILDFIIGSGGFRSRIFDEVRSARGLAYSAGSFYAPRPAYGVFGAYAFTKTASTAESLSVIRSILEDVKISAIGNENLHWAKKSIDSAFIFSFTSPSQIALQRLMLEYNGLPEDFLKTYRPMIQQVSPDDLQRVAQKYLLQECETTLVVGNAQHFDRPLSEFGVVNEVKGHD